ncbi:hypothetical protein ACFC5Z_12740 [Streptomyces sp. NPDC056004]
MVTRIADQGRAWDIAVYNAAGADVTFDFVFAREDSGDLVVAA